MNFKEISDKILYCTFKGKRYNRKIEGRGFINSLTWLEKLRKFNNKDLSFSENYLYSVKRGNTIVDIYNLPLRTLTERLTLAWSQKGILVIPECETCKSKLVFVDFIERKEQSFPVWICLNCSKILPSVPKIFIEGLSSQQVSKEELQHITKKLRGILEKELKEDLTETMKAYGDDFEGSYAYYDDEDVEAEEGECF